MLSKQNAILESMLETMHRDFEEMRLTLNSIRDNTESIQDIDTNEIAEGLREHLIKVKRDFRNDQNKKQNSE